MKTAMTSYRRSIIQTALLSRLLVIILQYVFNHLIPDHNAEVFLYPRENKTDLFLDKVVNHLFGGFLRWDAQYFMHIAKYGYTYENTVAFFPLYPILGSVLTKCFYFVETLSVDSLILLIFITINVIFFIQSALTLFDLSEKFFPEEFSYYSTLFFCWNPASVFFTSPYTECMFSLLTFKSMFNCVELYEKYSSLRRRIVPQDILYLLPIALSTITRSNGLLNIGFFLYVIACIFLKNFTQIRGNLIISAIKKISLIFAFTIVTTFGIIFCIVPFDIFQIYCYRLFCTDLSVKIPEPVIIYAKENNFVLRGTFSKHNQSWCSNKLPLAYSYVQKHYWNVGFLSYYEFKQIPNFLIAAPILLIFLINCKKYIQENFPAHLRDIFNLKIPSSRPYFIFDNPHLFVYIIHGFILSIFCIFFLHIQVSTRLLCSASPLLYWFSAHYFMDDAYCDMINFKHFSFRKKYLIIYYFTYFMIGIAFFCNFLPWT